MERIHKKSALSEATNLLLAAREFGAELLWERYERQLPLCAFTSNGLNCRKCLLGPCRVNPFGDEPSQGICGADRDQIVMENLFQTTLEGVLESARALGLLGIDQSDRELPDFAPDLPAETRERLSREGLLPVRKGDLLGVQNGFFSHKGFLLQTLKDLTRLGLIHYGFLKEIESSVSRTQIQDSPFHPEGINLLIVGQGPTGLIQALEQQAGQKSEGKRINLLVQGANRLSSMKAAADQGSSELTLGMNLDALIVSPNAAWPGLETLARKYGIPVILVDGGKPYGQMASEAIDQAFHHSQNASYGAPSRMLLTGDSGGGSILCREGELRKAMGAGRIGGAAVLFGEANVKQTFFDRTLVLMEAALAEKALILLGGDLGSQVESLTAELQKRKAAQFSSFASELQEDGLSPISTFGSSFEIPRVVALLSSLSHGKGNGSFPVFFAFPEFYRASTWASAVSLLSLGFSVQIGVSLPFWGSPSLTEVMKKEWEKIAGGTLLAAPVLPDAAAQAEELASFLRTKKFR
jgi:hypothetical protein